MFELGSSLRRTLPGISRSLHKGSSKRLTGQGIEALVYSLHHRPSKPPRSRSDWFCSDESARENGEDVHFIDDSQNNLNSDDTDLKTSSFGKMSKL